LMLQAECLLNIALPTDSKSDHPPGFKWYLEKPARLFLFPKAMDLNT
jgi:hypothetical protein